MFFFITTLAYGLWLHGFMAFYVTILTYYHYYHWIDCVVLFYHDTGGRRTRSEPLSAGGICYKPPFPPSPAYRHTMPNQYKALCSKLGEKILLFPLMAVFMTAFMTALEDGE